MTKKKVRVPDDAESPASRSQVPQPQYEPAPENDSLFPDDPKRTIRIPSWLIYGGTIVLVAVILPTVLYLTVFTENPEFQSTMWTCTLKISYRVPCLKEAMEVDDELCTRMGCCWNKTDKVCFHSLPSQHSYTVNNWVDNSTRDSISSLYLDLTYRKSLSPYGSSIANQLRTSVVPVSKTHLRIFMYDTSGVQPTLPERLNLTDTDFQVYVYGPDYFSLEISRREDEKLKFFSTSRGPLIASRNNFWEITLQFPTDNKVFGLGQLELTSTPKVLYNNKNRTGANPFIMVLNPKGDAHGVFFNNSGPMEFELLAESNLLIVRSLSTLYWDFSVFAGPTPKDVMEQFTKERRPVLPPQWVLGFHICRETEANTTLTYVNEFIEGSINLTLPYESDCLQERLLGGLDFVIPDSIKPAVDVLRGSGKKLLMSLQPQVNSSVFDNNQPFVKNVAGSGMDVNEYKNITVKFPDFFHNNAAIWLQDKLKTLQVDDILGGYVLQEDWPAVNSTQNIMTEIMDYVPHNSLSNGTLWWMAGHGNIPHYLVHNEYGLKFASSLGVSPDQIVLSTSTYTGSGAVGGSHAHAQAQVNCTWDNMATALNVALGLGLSGIPLVGGGPVCGNTGEYNEELCLRWYLMSSMLPLMRVSSTSPLRDPVNMTSFRVTVAEIVKERYSLISYFYSLFLESSKTGVPVARPVFFEYPTDNNTWDRYDHFMVGSALLVRPMFLPNQVSVLVYLPKEDIPWYHLRGGHKINNGTGGYEIAVSSLPTDLIALLRGGYIIPLQEEVGMSVAETVIMPYTLVVGLNCSQDGICNAVGDLNINQQNTLHFASSESGLIVESTCQDESFPLLEHITVYGLNITEISTANVIVTPDSCSNLTNYEAQMDEYNYVLKMNNLGVNLCCGQVAINWTLS